MQAALFFDVDGTIIFHDKTGSDLNASVLESMPTPAVFDAFKRARKNGHKTFICTGRPLCAVSKGLFSLEPDGFITQAGASAYVGGELVFEKLISADIIKITADLFMKAGVSALFEGDEGCITLATKPEHAVPEFPTVYSTQELLEKTPGNGFGKLVFVDAFLPNFNTVRKEIEKYYTVLDLGLGMQELSLKGIDKGTGINDVLGHLGLAGVHTYGFGDSENDLAMLKVVDTAVAMGNAMDNVKALADYIAPPVYDDGVVSAMEHFGLI